MENQLLIFGLDQDNKKNKSAAGIQAESSAKSLAPINKEKMSGQVVVEWSIFVDGAARGNPGPSGAGVYVFNSTQEAKEAFFLGERTNNQAEYLALVLALFILKQKVDGVGFRNIFVRIHSDSELLIRQLSGFYKIKNPVLIQLHGLIKQLLKGIPHKFIHVMREKNKIADRLANEGIDKKKKIPTKFFNFLADLDNGNNIIEMLKK